MKKSAVTFLVFMAVILIASNSLVAQISTKAVQPSVQAETMINPSRDGMNVLVLRDDLPWGFNCTPTILNDLGATVSTATSVSYPGLDFMAYDKIVMESVQSGAFYTTFQANMAKFEAYVIAGGILQINGCTQEISFALPGEVSCVYSPSFNGYHAMPGHPFLEGVPDPFFGSWASHNIMTNLLPGTEVITRDTPNNDPTTVVYKLGAGSVIVSGLTLEIAYEYEYHGWGVFNFGLAMYPNMLGYMPDSQEIPLSGWALVIGIVLIGGLVVLRYRRIF